MKTEHKDKEQIHDEQISPLMEQIIQICAQNGIAMIACFALPTSSNHALRSATLTPDGNGNLDKDQLLAAQIMGFPFHAATKH